MHDLIGHLTGVFNNIKNSSHFYSSEYSQFLQLSTGSYALERFGAFVEGIYTLLRGRDQVL